LDQPAPAILRDAAAGPTEFMVGVPGQHLAITKINSIVGLPHLGGGRLYYSKLMADGRDVEVRTQTLEGSCAHSLGPGQLQAVTGDGSTLLLVAAGKYHLIDSNARQLAELTPASYVLANNGVLVKLDAHGLTVYDRRGAHPKPLKSGTFTVLGPIGATGILVSDATGSQVIDVVTGATSALGGRRFYVASGSPDGKYVASSDLAGAPVLIKIADGSSTNLPKPGPVVGFAWSEDSAYVGVQTLLGGAIWNVATATGTDLGPLVVAGW
jgi:hypothetical protein